MLFDGMSPIKLDLFPDSFVPWIWKMAIDNRSGLWARLYIHSIQRGVEKSPEILPCRYCNVVTKYMEFRVRRHITVRDIVRNIDHHNNNVSLLHPFCPDPSLNQHVSVSVLLVATRQQHSRDMIRIGASTTNPKHTEANVNAPRPLSDSLIATGSRGAPVQTL